MRKTISIGVAALALALSTSGAQADNGAGPNVKAGVLTCHVADGWGFVFGSSHELHCTYRPVKGRVEHYAGHINKFGVDIGYSEDGVIVWAVFAPSADIAGEALAGTYAGATAGAAVGVGAGANVLVGGINNSVALQPVSIEGEAGLNVAAGIGEIHLHPAAE